MPPAGMPITTAAAQLARVAGAVLPGAPWIGAATSVATVASVFTDLFVARRLSRPLPEDDTRERLRAMYLEEADRMRAQRAAPAAAAQSPQGERAREQPVLAPAPSRYLASEGAREDPNGIEEGCVPCALGHDGAGQGMLERAAEEAEREGRCGPACQAWYVPATREYLALLRHDLTPPRIAQTPPEQRPVLQAHVAEVAVFKDALVSAADPDPERRAVREAIVGADASIIEATRFTGSGDPVDHPLVQRRLHSAEPDLLAGERGRMGTPPPEVKAKVRANRQDLLNRMQTPADLARVAAAAEEIDVAVMAPAVQGLSPADVRAAAARAAALRQGFKQGLAQAAAPVQSQIAAASGAVPAPQTGAA